MLRIGPRTLILLIARVAYALLLDVIPDGSNQTSLTLRCGRRGCRRLRVVGSGCITHEDGLTLRAVWPRCSVSGRATLADCCVIGGWLDRGYWCRSNRCGGWRCWRSGRRWLLRRERGLHRFGHRFWSDDRNCRSCRLCGRRHAMVFNFNRQRDVFGQILRPLLRRRQCCWRLWRTVARRRKCFLAERAWLPGLGPLLVRFRESSYPVPPGSTTDVLPEGIGAAFTLFALQVEQPPLPPLHPPQLSHGSRPH